MITISKATAEAKKVSKPRTARKIIASAKPGAPAPSLAATVPATKREQLAALLVRDEGATIEQIIAATGWLPHTVRAAITGLKKRGYAIDSDKFDGVRTYRAVAPK